MSKVCVGGSACVGGSSYRGSCVLEDAQEKQKMCGALRAGPVLPCALGRSCCCSVVSAEEVEEKRKGARGKEAHAATENKKTRHLNIWHTASFTRRPGARS
jgi:hypothetical protein